MAEGKSIKENKSKKKRVEQGSELSSTLQSSPSATPVENPRITHAKVDSLCIYEITDGELDVLEKGSPNSIYLNFAILLISAAISFLISIFTSTLSQTVFIIFTLVVVIFALGGIFLLILWRRSKNDFEETIKRVKGRLRE